MTPRECSKALFSASTCTQQPRQGKPWPLQAQPSRTLRSPAQHSLARLVQKAAGGALAAHEQVLLQGLLVEHPVAHAESSVTCGGKGSARSGGICILQREEAGPLSLPLILGAPAVHLASPFSQTWACAAVQSRGSPLTMRLLTWGRLGARCLAGSPHTLCLLLNGGHWASLWVPEDISSSIALTKLCKLSARLCG